MTVAEEDAQQRSRSWVRGAETAALMGLLVMAAALLGIYSRPMGQLASLWPANALLLGLLVRFPARNTPAAWLGALAGYLAADLLTGSTLATALLLTGGNLLGIATGQWLLSRLPIEDRRLQGPFSVPRLLLVTTAASAMAGLVGFLIGPSLLGLSPLLGWVFCFVSELANYLAFLPAVLTLPEAQPHRGPERRRRLPPWPALGHAVLPALALLLSCLLAMAVAGPGAVAFPVPALLWCALSYGVFGTALLTLGFGAWALICIAQGLLPVESAGVSPLTTLMSIRLGVSLIAIAPITVACVMAARQRLLKRLQHMASHDQLSGLLNRHAFQERAQELLLQLAATRQPVALLMLDIDHFKRINDAHGHAVGDRVLVAFARLGGEALREVDLFGRVGGEEFAILLPGCEATAALAVAERVRQAFHAATLDDGRGGVITASVSVGVVALPRAQAALEPLLLRADEALYRAKRAGRNRVEPESPRPGGGTAATSDDTQPRWRKAS